MSGLFDPLRVRGLTLENRVVMAPMNMYMAADDGCANDEHLVHYASRVVGGVGLVLTENVGVSPEGRTSAQDLGLWQDSQIEGLERITRLVHRYGSRIGIQLQHAGRKSKVAEVPLAPSQIAYPGLPLPAALDTAGIERLVGQYSSAATRAVEAGFDCIEVHAAHGYLLHEFLSPITNHRTDDYGGSLENRLRLTEEVVAAVRAAMPDSHPLIVRFSAGDILPGGSDFEEATIAAARLVEAGVDVFSVSTGNVLPGYEAAVFPGYQAPPAAELKRRLGATVAVSGSITSSELADYLVSTGSADLVLLGRALIVDPNWTIGAARAAGASQSSPVPGYARATGPYERGF